MTSMGAKGVNLGDARARRTAGEEKLVGRLLNAVSGSTCHHSPPQLPNMNKFLPARTRGGLLVLQKHPTLNLIASVARSPLPSSNFL